MRQPPEPASLPDDLVQLLRSLVRPLRDETLSVEARAFGCVQAMLTSLDMSSEYEEGVSACMALHTLGCRVGLSVCTQEILALSFRLAAAVEAVVLSGGNQWTAGAATHALAALLWFEAPPKMPPDVRMPIEKETVKGLRDYIAAIGKLETQQVADAVCKLVRTGALADIDDLSLSYGATMVVHKLLLYRTPATIESAVAAGLFGSVLALRDRISPPSSPSPASAAVQEGAGEARERGPSPLKRFVSKEPDAK